MQQVFGGGGGKKKSGDTKSVNIVELLDVGVPLRTAYNRWTQCEEFSRFTKGVRSVSKSEEMSSDWKLKVGPSSRSWKATVQEQVPDERIVWTSEGAKGTTRGCVSFHELTPTLTRLVLVVEYYPSGLFEKTGNLWRAQGRRLRLDFKHFPRYVTFADEDVEGWRGDIRDGEVVRSHEEVVEEGKQRTRTKRTKTKRTRPRERTGKKSTKTKRSPRKSTKRILMRRMKKGSARKTKSESFRPP